MKRLLIATAAMVLVTAGAAHADTIFSGNFSVWSANTTGADASATAGIQQALPSASSDFTGPNVNTVRTGSGTYSGQLNFTDSNDNTIAGFFGDDVGTFTHSDCSGTCGSSALSGANYGHVTLFEFVITLSQNGTLTIGHDDGVSLFVDGNTATDLLPVGDSAPTTDVDSLATVGPGTYDLWYTEANGLPADLNVNFVATAVPEPASVALLGAGLVAFGAARRRRRKAA